ncbi:hypothetical protein STENM327S_08558 [Streptomyces tendae]
MMTRASPSAAGRSPGRRREAVDAFEGGAERGGHDVDADDAGHGEQVHQGEAAGAVHDVLGGEGGVAGAEGEEPVAVRTVSASRVPAAAALSASSSRTRRRRSIAASRN